MLPLRVLPAALALVAAAGCSDPGPVPILRPDLDVGRVEGPAEEAGEDLLAGPAQPGEGWRAGAWVGWSVDLGAAPEGAARAGDRLELGPAPGIWVRVVPVEPGRAYELTAAVAGGGLEGEAQARVGLLELAAAPTAATWGDLAAAAVGGDYGSPLKDLDGATPRPVATWLHTGPATTHLVLFAGLVDPAGTGAAWVRVEDPALVPGDRAGRVAAALGDDDPDRPAGPVTVAMTERTGRVLVAGETLTLPLGATPGHLVPGARLELPLALVPRPRDPRAPDLGATLTLTAALGSGGAEHPLAEVTLATAETPDERWAELDLALDALLPDLDAEDVTLLVRATSELAPLDAPLGLVGAPRLVPPAPARPGPNLVVVSLDTLRADRMSLYGHDRPTTPRLDAFAADALVFDAAWSNGAYTLPSHMSLFTGQVPSVHGVQGAGLRRDPGRSPLLAEVLAARGWTTAAFTGGGFVNPTFGFGAGFERYGTLDPLVNTGSAKLRADLAGVPNVDLELLQENELAVALDWLEDHADESVFLFLHTYAAHQFDPWPRHADALGLEGELADDARSLELLYNGGEGGTPDEFARLLDWYDATVLQADEGVGRLVDTLERLDLVDDTIVIVTSDHGKELGEHGAVGHGHALYEEMVRVPLLVHVPPALAAGTPFAPGRSAVPVSLVDLVPTVLEALDVAPWPGLQGRSLLELGPSAPDAPVPEAWRRPVLAEVDNLAVKFALREGDTKIIWSPLDREAFLPNTVELETFDLGADPLEQASLPADPARLARVRATYDALRAWAAELGAVVEAGLDDPALRADLEALGYVDDVRRASE